MEGTAEKENDTWTHLLREGVSGITTDTDDSIYLFKEDCYWKFMFPGSTPEPGYPRSVATDWLDCPNSSLPTLGDLSLSSHPATRQEVQETRREERVGGAGEDEERGDQQNPNKIRDGPQLRACTCNTAPATRTTGVSVALVLGWRILSTI
ncbi:hypothetical protein NHX12_011932 [Muraenolepis orangiensis]|uniref:Uncharacterized protein n=1 Tax=Muraenolepis orangiensis TaxID=630683 RepID=A0A9Q0I778_9TELE|nr:hypothetical protein NHX12_011932 [Muraenolepis orangiensis]